jgi:formate dehydrogenase subunit gamma
MSARAETTVTRFSKLERREHLAVMALFAVLALTGFPQKFYDHRWAQVLTGWLGGVDTARWFHRAAGITFGALLVAHVLRLVVSVVRQTTTLSMVPTRQDFRDAVQTINYYLRRSESAPRFDRFDYRQKFEYWGMLLGSAVVVGTGVALLFPIQTALWLPGQLIPAAYVAHSQEGLMAFLVVIVWHIYNAHLNPDVFPFDRSIFSGEISEHRLKHEHALEYERLRQAAPGAPVPPAEHPYRRLPWPAQLIAAPLAGSAFAMLLPGLGIGVAAKAALDAVTGRRGARPGRGATPLAADPPQVRKAG